MKTLIASALIATATLTGAANASLPGEIQFYAPNADLTALSTTQENQLISILHSSDSNSEKRGKIRQILN